MLAKRKGLNVTRSRRLWLVVAVGAVALTTVAFTMSAGAGPKDARATLRDVNGNVVGVVKLSLDDGKIGVKATVDGLAAGFHGFHIHSVGTCDPSVAFVSAGGHLNPNATTHPSHAGDQPVLLVNGDGTAELRFASDRYTLDDLFDADGSAFIVHAGADNYANIPARYSAAGIPGPDAATLATGDAGARSACGVILPG
jgi:superoxide dismutase, Cu-Zn family